MRMATGWSGVRREAHTYENRLKALALGAVILTALYTATILPLRRMRTVNMSKAGGIASSRASVSEHGLSRQTGFNSFYPQSRAKGVSAACPEACRLKINSAGMMTQESESPAEASEDRKMIRSCSIDLVVQRPAETAEKIRSTAERLGGFLVSSEIRGEQDANNGTLTIRVPAARFEEARAENYPQARTAR